MLFNIVYVPILGIEGAALANIGGYTVTNIICGLVLLKMKLIVIKARFVFMTILVYVVMGIWMLYTYNSLIQGLLLACSYLAICLYLHRNDLLSLYQLAIKR